MNLNKGEWFELLTGLLVLNECQVVFYNSKQIILVKKVSYGGDFFVSKEDIKSIDVEKLKAQIIAGKKTFGISAALIEQCGFKKGSSNNKADIILEYLYKSDLLVDNFGIKALDLRPSLLNASKATNFKFKVKNVKKDFFKLKTKKLLSNFNKSDLIFEGCVNKRFEKNLRMIDSLLDSYLAKMLVCYFQGEGSRVIDVLNNVFGKHENYEAIRNRIKDFLYYTCVGMFPNLEWNGEEQIVGTLVYSKDDGVFCLHRMDINNFKNFLLENAFFDTASTSRHDFGYLKKEGNDTTLILNLLIRIRKY